MRVLVIGGTVFLGRAVVEVALARGHEVTVFHRGLHGSSPTETIVGDRTRDLDRLAGREWDVVIDTCGFEPAHVAASVGLLSESCRRYVFVSTAGVYSDWPDRPVPDEDAPLHETGDGYSELKAACERAAEAAMPNRVAVVRPGMILGPHENVGRGPWWLARMARGGRILAPGPADAPFQFIDVRDLATMLLDAQPGAYNATCAPITWGDFLEAAFAAARGPDAELVWTDAARVHAAVPDSWNILPMWPAPDLTAVYGVGTKHPLPPLRSIGETMADTWATGSEASDWRQEMQVEGIDPARETAILDG